MSSTRWSNAGTALPTRCGARVDFGIGATEDLWQIEAQCPEVGHHVSIDAWHLCIADVEAGVETHVTSER